LLTPLTDRKRSGLFKDSGKYGLFCLVTLKNNVFSGWDPEELINNNKT